MIKYTNITGYATLGECGLCSHLYQWISNIPDEQGFRTLILVRAYEAEPKLFKGKLLMTTKQTMSEEVLSEELKPLEELLGKITVYTDFQAFIKGHETERQFKEFSVKVL